MKNVMCGACLALVVTVAVGAQEKMASSSAAAGMAGGKTYSGCLERTPDGMFSLTHVMAAGAKAGAKDKKSMAADSMKKDSGHDGMAMKGEPMDHKMDHEMDHGMAGMDHNMVPASLQLSSTAVDLKAHVGHKVTVTGSTGEAMNGMTAFTVASLKMTAKSCS